MAEKVEQIKLLPHFNFTRAFTPKTSPNMVSMSRVRRLFHSNFPRGLSLWPRRDDLFASFDDGVKQPQTGIPLKNPTSSDSQ